MLSGAPLLTIQPMFLCGKKNLYDLYYLYVKKNVEVDGVRSLQDDKIAGKIVEVDNEIPAEVGMRNYTQKNL